MNVFIREIRANLRSILLWNLGVLFIIAISMMKFSAIPASDQSMNDIIAGMPSIMKGFMGGGQFDLSSISGYYGVLFGMIVLAAAIHAMLLGTDILAKEERDKTAEFLYTKPRARVEIVSAKFAAALCSIVVFTLITWLSSMLMMSQYDDLSANAIMILMITLLLIELFFLTFGMALSALFKRAKVASAVGMGTLLFTYLLSVTINMDDSLGDIAFLSPFHYFDTANIISNGGGIHFGYALTLIILSAVSTVVTFTAYRKRDLTI